MTTRTKTLGVAAALTAIAFSIPTAITASADDPTPTPSTAVSTPVAPIPDPQGPGCDAYKAGLPAGGAAAVAKMSASEAIANNPDLKTFNAAISGQLNPEVNIVSVLDNGPYNVFAPTDEAFAKLDPAQFDALKADPAALTATIYYTMVLGLLGADEVHGKYPTQQGAQLTVTGKGGDIKVNDVAKVVCGDIEPANSRIYMMDTVLDPSTALPGNETTTTSATSTTETTSSETSTTETTTSAPSAPSSPTTATAVPAPPVG